MCGLNLNKYEYFLPQLMLWDWVTVAKHNFESIKLSAIDTSWWIKTIIIMVNGLRTLNKYA